MNLEASLPPRGTPQKFLEELESEITRPEPSIIIAEKGKTPIGFAYHRYKDSFVEIEEIDVPKEYQSQGIGKALVRRMEEIAKEKQIKRLATGTSLNADGKPWKAYGFWIRMGFVDTGKRTQGPHGLKYAEFIKQL
jgi:GNAT superfamily N-acetyltransferase